MTTTVDPSQAEFGKYRLLRKLAQGGMAEIFLALQRGIQGFEKVVVIKRVLPELSASDEFVNMFLDEARIAARLDHNNVVRIYDLGEINGQYYIAMEYIPGEDLASVLQQCKRGKILLPIETAVDAIIGAAEGLLFAHELEDADGNSMNLVHRDVSPSNILLSYQGQVKLVDFGIARAETNVSKTEGGQLKGKIQYLAPEQCRGLRVDCRTDIFALGITLHELLTCKRLFQRENQYAAINAILNEPIPPPSASRPEIPKELDEIVMKALERDMAKRYQTAGQLAADLSVYLIERDYQRSGAKFVELLTQLFGEDRKKVKLRVAKGQKLDELATPGGPRISGSFPAVVHTPGSQSGSGAHGSGQWTPLRSDPRVSAPQLTPGGSRVDMKSAYPTGTSSSRSSLPAVATPARPSAPPPPPQLTPPGIPPLLEAEPATDGAALPPAKRPSPGVVRLAGIAAGALLLVVLGIVVATRGGKTETEPLVVAPPPKVEPPKPDPVKPEPVKPDPAVGEQQPGLAVGGMKFSGLPAEAKVTVDGNAVANPAADSFFAAGKHQVAVEAKGFLPFEVSVDVAAGKVAPVEVAMKPRPTVPMGFIDLVCQPWCQISVDGRDTGKTSPARISVTAGAHTLMLSNGPAGLAKKITVTVGENAVVKKTVKLDD